MLKTNEFYRDDRRVFAAVGMKAFSKPSGNLTQIMANSNCAEITVLDFSIQLLYNFGNLKYILHTHHS
jgi:hypothetical protein